MSASLLLKALFAAAISGAFAWAVFFQGDPGTENPDEPLSRPRYHPFVPGLLLPLFVLVLIVLGWWQYGWTDALRLTFYACSGILLHIALYDILLVAALPLLRQRISAVACATLWMIPNYLYLTAQSVVRPSEPLLILDAGRWTEPLFKLWLAGTLCVLGGSILSHLVFRFRILRHARPNGDPTVQALWEAEIRRAKIKKVRFRLVISPDTATPLSIGLFERTIRVVLPDHPYTPEELTLIFRHELVHIGREDTQSKFFLVFCTAFCWFNPLMWIAMHRCAEDLELSCDETVLADADDIVRRRYAHLILDTAGDNRGFTTCLSSAASSLRYRLRAIVSPSRRRSGALIVGLAFFILFMTCGYTALAYGGGEGSQLIFQSRSSDELRLSSVMQTDANYHTTYRCTDKQALFDYLSSLQLKELTGGYDFDQDDNRLSLVYDTADGPLVVVLSDSSVKVVPLYGEDPQANSYYLPGGLDRQRIDALLIPDPALRIRFSGSEQAVERSTSATLSGLWRRKGERTVPLISPELSQEEINIISGYEMREVTLDFSQPPISPVAVEIQSEPDGTPQTMTLPAQTQQLTLPLSAPSALYTIRATFDCADGSQYDAVFRFRCLDAW